MLSQYKNLRFLKYPFFKNIILKNYKNLEMLINDNTNVDVYKLPIITNYLGNISSDNTRFFYRNNNTIFYKFGIRKQVYYILNDSYYEIRNKNVKQFSVYTDSIKKIPIKNNVNLLFINAKVNIERNNFEDSLNILSIHKDKIHKLELINNNKLYTIKQIESILAYIKSFTQLEILILEGFENITDELLLKIVENQKYLKHLRIFSSKIHGKNIKYIIDKYPGIFQIQFFHHEFLESEFKKLDDSFQMKKLFLCDNPYKCFFYKQIEKNIIPIIDHLLLPQMPEG
ncbi:hypothetical protein KKF34_08890 [Myxococcota bacterium]|nr:hypothetical protein [Myxococcota bacterium]MBU1380635.1 hypothetical protein [Myxococcota bacterium]MBU1496977.1 hypothetical protein [Myxococcota bacterium]